jgi:spore germination protein YaaH
VLRGNVQSYINRGTPPEKLILGVPWYGYVAMCAKGSHGDK